MVGTVQIPTIKYNLLIQGDQEGAPPNSNTLRGDTLVVIRRNIIWMSLKAIIFTTHFGQTQLLMSVTASEK